MRIIKLRIKDPSRVFFFVTEYNITKDWSDIDIDDIPHETLRRLLTSLFLGIIESDDNNVAIMEIKSRLFQSGEVEEGIKGSFYLVGGNIYVNQDQYVIIPMNAPMLPRYDDLHKWDYVRQVFVAPLDGIYAFHGYVKYLNSGAFDKTLYITSTGGFGHRIQGQESSNDDVLIASGIVKLQKDDVVFLETRHNSSSAEFITEASLSGMMIPTAMHHDHNGIYYTKPEIDLQLRNITPSDNRVLSKSPLETPDGINRTFTINGGFRYKPNSLVVYVNGLNEDDFIELSDAQFQLGFIPETDDEIKIDYTKLI